MTKPTATREELEVLAQNYRSKIDLPPGCNVVVVVTDESGKWVGVSGSADFSYTQRMLQSALSGADLQFATDSAFEELHVLARKVADGEFTEDAAAELVGEICTRFGPSAVKVFDDYYAWKLAAFRKSKP